MSNSRRLRRQLKTSRDTRAARFPEKPPALGTVRRWLQQGVAQGMLERGPDEHTGKPGRPAMLYGLTEAGKARAAADPRDFKAHLTELQAKRAHALMKKGMTEDQAIDAVTRGWAKRPGTSRTA